MVSFSRAWEKGWGEAGVEMREEETKKKERRQREKKMKRWWRLEKTKARRNDKGEKR